MTVHYKEEIMFRRAQALILVLLVFVALFAVSGTSWAITLPIAPQVSAGRDFAVELKSDGTLWAWGNNQYGQLGDGTAIEKYSPVQIGTDNDWAMVAAGEQHAVAIKTDGSLWAWGYNFSGQLGDGTTIDKHSPTQISIPNTNNNDWSQISASGRFTMALKNVQQGSGRELWAWGENSSGQLGDGTKNNSLSPVRIGSDSDWSAVAPGHFHTLALKSGGTLWAWGLNFRGQLGNDNLTDSVIPVQIGNDNHWSAAAAGYFHSVALKSDGTLWTWGGNSRGELGDGTGTNKTAPTQEITAATDWEKIAAGYYTTMALKRGSGALWAWGDNDYGQLGDGTNVSKTFPTDMRISGLQSVKSDIYFSIALKTDGSVWTWGKNTYGVLGIGIGGITNFPIRIGSDIDWTAISAGWNHSLAIKNGALYAWGENHYGQLGDGFIDTKSSPTRIGNETGWSAVAAGTHNSFALKNGALFAWGRNLSGQLGDGTRTNSLVPKQIGTESNWATIATGEFHTVALKNVQGSGGELWAWGENIFGQLGDGTTTYNPTPKRIGTESDWAAVSASGYYNFALKADGTLWAWGQFNGSKTPAQVKILYNPNAKDNDWKAISASVHDALALKTNGTLWRFEVQRPPRQIGFDSDWAAVSTGRDEHFAQKSDGSLYAWGENYFGQLGDGTTSAKSSPVQITIPNINNNNDWSLVSAGIGFFNLGLKNVQPGTGGELWAWGLNDSGQLGDGTPLHYSPVQIQAPQRLLTIKIFDQTTDHSAPPGTVTTPDGMNCSGTICTKSYDSGAIVQLTATPDIIEAEHGDSWLKYSGGGAVVLCRGNTCTVKMDSDMTIGTSFQWKEFAVSYTFYPPNGGSVFCESYTRYGANGTCNVSPNSGYSVDMVTLDDGTPLVGELLYGNKYKYTVSNMTADRSINVTFKPNVYNIATNVIGSGNITCTPAAIPEGQDATCTITPDSGYVVSDVKVDGTSVKPASSYTFTNVKTDHTISVTTILGRNLKVIPVLYGIISCPWAIPAGSGASCTIGAYDAYSVTDVIVDGISKGPRNKYDFTDDGSDHTITVKVAKTGTVYPRISQYLDSLEVRRDGTLWGWGQVSHSTYISYSPGQFFWTGYEGPEIFFNDWATVKATDSVNYALKRDGTLWVLDDWWLPEQIGTDNNWVAIAGAQGKGTGIVALKNDGSLWGGILKVDPYYDPATTTLTRIGSKQWREAAAGRDFIAAIDLDGKLWTWGENGYGQLGTGTTASSTNPVQVTLPNDDDANPNPWIAVAVSDFNVLALKEDGTLWAWGDNLEGNLGDGTYGNHRNSPIQVKILNNPIAKDNDWGAISIGRRNSLALKKDGSLWSWGYNAEGQVGNGTTGSGITSPVQIGIDADWAEIQAANTNTSMALKNDGTLWTWGTFTGDGTSNTVLSPKRITDPMIVINATTSDVNGVITPSGLVTVKNNESNTFKVTPNFQNGYAISAVKLNNVPISADPGTFNATDGSASYTLADIKSDSSITASFIFNPQNLSITKTGTGTGTVTASAAGTASLACGSVCEKIYVLGTIVTLSAIPDASSVFTGWSGVCSGTGTCTVTMNNDIAVTASFAKIYTITISQPTNGTITCTPASPVISGTNAACSIIPNSGYIVNNVTVDGGSIGPVTTVPFNNISANHTISATMMKAVIKAENVAAGYNHVVVVKPDGTLWGWGSNYYGQLGEKCATSTCLTPFKLDDSTEWSAVAAGAYHTLALKKDGSLWAWGDNSVGQLGIGTPEPQVSAPRQVGDEKTWTAIAAGQYHNLALKSDGTMWAWGNNRFGQLAHFLDGYGTISKNSPVQVVPYSNPSVTSWKAIAAGDWFSLALQKDNNNMWSWGSYDHYQLGSSNMDSPGPQGPGYFWDPAQVGNLVGIDFYRMQATAMAAGADFAIALKSNGTLWGWGDNSRGQLGNNSISFDGVHAPLQIGDKTDWLTISAGRSHTLATNTNGELYAWGENLFGQLGLGESAKNQLTPTRVGTGLGWTTVVGRANFTIGVKNGESIYAWGDNSTGQLGDGTTTARKSPVCIINCPAQTAGFASNSAAVETIDSTSMTTQIVQLVDTALPVVTAPADVTAEANGVQTVISIGTATAADNVGVVSLTNDAPSSFPVGTTTVTWTARDAAGNVGTATQKVTVKDTTAPMVTAPADVTVDATNTLTTVSIGTASATDKVGVVSLTNDAPASFPIGMTTVTWTARDAAGNTGTAIQKITVNLSAAILSPTLGNGDLNYDGQVTVEDALLVLQIAVGQKTTAKSTLSTMSSVTYTVQDALKVLKRALGLI